MPLADAMAPLLLITLTTAAGAALLATWLGVRTVALRRRHSVAFGDGGQAALLARMRAQANFTEYTPVFVLLILAVELAAGSVAWLWLAAFLFLIGRVLHVFGMDRPAPNGPRIAGMIITFTLLPALAFAAIWIAAGR